MLWLWILLGVLAVLLALCLIVTWLCILKVVKAERHDEQFMRGQEERNGSLDVVEAWERDMDRRPFTLESNGVILSGEYVENPADTGTPRRVAIVCHGHTVNRFASFKYASIFYRAGYSIVLYDERYFGRSTGDRSTLGQEEVGDLVNVIAWTREHFGRDAVIGLHGESMGAATVLLCLAYEKPAFVIADCPFARSMLLFKHILEDNLHLPSWPILWLVDPLGGLLYDYRPGRVNPIEAVERSEVPVCFMHGTSDSLIPHAHSEMMYAVCKNPDSELHLFEGSEHADSFYKHREEYDRLMTAFIRKCEPVGEGK